MTLEEEIRAIQEEMDKTQKNKATEHHMGRLKAKMARLKDELIKKAIASRGGGAEGYSVKKSGDATVTLVGFPSVGKSTLINKLTDAHSEVGSYDFTTLDVIPGIMEYKQARIQVLDLPGLVKGASSGRGRGREVISVIRGCDLIVLIIDVFNYQHMKVLEDELYDAGIRINQRPPDVTITKLVKGGITITSTVELSIDHETIKTVLGEYRMHNALVNIREDITADQLIDVVRGNRVYIPCITVVNKIDLVDKEHMKSFPKDALKISADMESGLDALRDEIYDSLGFINIYLKPQGEPADMDEPLIMRAGCTVGDVCDRLHKDFRRKFRYARVWGDSAKHAGQRVGVDHGLEDGDVLTVIIQK
ncbi:GTP-binding protein [Methanocella paludicola SANAE]|jgi:small GTP-binding protein|uniref:GTP-binding protein n=1 Tax=Methanocella paludicola (strain DSM 17711 / JCM 13418 / NBRC 101707 / SANAE) TaxID=304371 RepID=D1YV59_METPS|nr:GTP-binding protein [Methanocella paludicola]BAI60331.1 GTP-binding protein [Methanocella paludicola SANAE]